MKPYRTFLLSLAISLVASVNLAAQANDASLHITATKDGYELNVPVSKLLMTITSKSPLETKKGGSGSPRYFYFEDKNGLIISGWFEPAESFAGIQKFWDSETKEWKRRGLPDPVDVSMQKIDGWDAIIYDIKMPKGTNSHIRAHWVQAGTWIDVHLSLTTTLNSVDARAKLQEVLKSIQVKEKTKG
jgi:hypothetical protein